MRARGRTRAKVARRSAGTSLDTKPHAHLLVDRVAQADSWHGFEEVGREATEEAQRAIVSNDLGEAVDHSRVLDRTAGKALCLQSSSHELERVSANGSGRPPSKRSWVLRCHKEREREREATYATTCPQKLLMAPHVRCVRTVGSWPGWRAFQASLSVKKTLRSTPAYGTMPINDGVMPRNKVAGVSWRRILAKQSVMPLNREKERESAECQRHVRGGARNP